METLPKAESSITMTLPYDACTLFTTRSIYALQMLSFLPSVSPYILRAIFYQINGFPDVLLASLHVPLALKLSLNLLELTASISRFRTSNIQGRRGPATALYGKVAFYRS